MGVTASEANELAKLLMDALEQMASGSDTTALEATASVQRQAREDDEGDLDDEDMINAYSSIAANVYKKLEPQVMRFQSKPFIHNVYVSTEFRNNWLTYCVNQLMIDDDAGTIEDELQRRINSAGSCATNAQEAMRLLCGDVVTTSAPSGESTGVGMSNAELSYALGGKWWSDLCGYVRSYNSAPNYDIVCHALRQSTDIKENHRKIFQNDNVTSCNDPRYVSELELYKSRVNEAIVSATSAYDAEAILHGLGASVVSPQSGNVVQNGTYTNPNGVVVDDSANVVSDTYDDGTPKDPSMTAWHKQGKINNLRNKRADAFYDTQQSAEPVTQQQVDDVFPEGSLPFDDDLLVAIQQQMQSYGKTQQHKDAAQSSRTEPPDEAITFKKNTYKVGGQVREYSVAEEVLDFSVLKGTQNPINELERLITKRVLSKFGGVNRIRTIAVRDQQMIINGVAYVPKFKDGSVDINDFPLDTYDYINNGSIASFFDWSALKHMRSLVALDIDDASLYAQTISSQLGMGRQIGVSTIFRVVPSLMEFTLGNDTIRRDELHTEKSVPIKQRLGIQRHVLNFSDGYKWDVVSATSKFNDFTFRCMRDWCVNRGDKSFWKFYPGAIGRIGFAAFGGVVNLASHIIGGIKDVLVSAVQNSTTPVSEQDMYS